MEHRALLVALGVFLLVFLVALGSSRSLDRVSGPGDLASARLVAGNLIILIVAVAVIPAVLFVIWQSLRYLRGEGGLTPERRRERKIVKQVLVIALIGGVLALLALAQKPSARPAAPPASRRLPSTPIHPNAVPQRTAEALLPWVVAGVGTCLVVLLFLALIQRRRRRLTIEELPEIELESPRQELHELVGISIADIERESDPRRAVIRAYAGMESTLARHDLGRRPFEAPGEYLGRAFGALRLSRRPGERLTELFEQARFSAHVIGPEMKRESIAALGELRSELEAKPQ